MFLDWLLKMEEDSISYDELKMLAVGTRQIKMVSVKMETYHMGRIQQQQHCILPCIYNRNRFSYFVVGVLYRIDKYVYYHTTL